MRQVLVINDLFDDSPEGGAQFDEFAAEYLRGISAVAFRFSGTRPMLEQVDAAVEKAIAGGFDAVILDVYFGKVGDKAARLGIDVALPKLLQARVPVLILSALADETSVLENILDAQKHGNVKYLTADRLDLLPSYLEGFERVRPENATDLQDGFRFRHASEISTRRRVQDVFEAVAEAIGSVAIEVPIAAPVSNFLGRPPRPLTEKSSHRLFAAVLSDASSMAIRYEGTALVAKWVAAQVSAEPGKSIYLRHYFQEMLRVEPSSDLDHVHLRSFHQAGIEAFAEDEQLHGDNIVKVLRATLEFIHALNLSPTIRLSHVDILRPLLQRAGLDQFAEKRVRAAMEKANEGEIEQELSRLQIPGAERALLMQLPALRSVPLGEGVAFMGKHLDVWSAAHTSLADLRDSLEQSGHLAECLFDPGVDRSLGFYSGIILQGDVPELRECLGGGEYTGLVESFGVIGPVHSFGMAVGVERLLGVLAGRSADVVPPIVQ